MTQNKDIIFLITITFFNHFFQIFDVKCFGFKKKQELYLEVLIQKEKEKTQLGRSLGTSAAIVLVVVAVVVNSTSGISSSGIGISH